MDFFMVKLSKMLLVIAFLVGGEAPCASEAYPASVSFLVADYKYSEGDGVKICEIQTLGVSTISVSGGYKKLYRKGEISFSKITKTLRPYFQDMWLTGIGMHDPKLKHVLVKDGWRKKKSTKKLENDRHFKKLAQRVVKDPTDLNSYHGLLCARRGQIQPIEGFKAAHPGILIVDEFMFPYRADKYKLTAIFEQDPELQKYKPNWKCYPKVYTKDLADTILCDMGCDIVVIKPRTQYRGRGVCIVEKRGLDGILKAIITKKSLSAEGKIAYWQRDQSSDFIVEQFIESDPLEVQAKGYRRFDPTFRMIFCVTSHQHKISVVPIGAFGKLPMLSLDEKGSMEEKHKSKSWEGSHYAEIPSEVRKEMERQLTDCIARYYRQVLKQSI